jgi:HEAT repeat protein
MRNGACTAVVTALALVSGCSRQEVPRQDAPASPGLSANLPPAPDAAQDAPPVAADTGAAVLVETLRDHEDAAVLAETLREHEDPMARREAIYALADVEDANGATIIGQALTDPDSIVRAAAIEAMTGIRDETATDWLSVGLGDPDPRVRQSAVEALGEVGGETARFLLQQALADVDPGVRAAARQMLEEPAFAGPEAR